MYIHGWVLNTYAEHCTGASDWAGPVDNLNPTQWLTAMVHRINTKNLVHGASDPEKDI